MTLAMDGRPFSEQFRAWAIGQVFQGSNPSSAGVSCVILDMHCHIFVYLSVPSFVIGLMGIILTFTSYDVS